MISQVSRIGRAVLWVLATGRDRDLAPPLGWWRGPVWLWRLLVLAAAGFWAVRNLSAWVDAAGTVAVAVLLVVPQIASPLLSRDLPVTAVRVALLGTVAAMVVLAGTVPAQPSPRPSWPLDTYLLPFAPVLALAIARARIVHGAGIALVAAAPLAAGVLLYRATVTADVMAGPLAGLAVTVVIGFGLNYQRRAADAAARAAATEREQRLTLQERARIARELHDVIGHHLSMIAVRAEGAPYRLPKIGEAARAELAELAATAREALDETRRLLGVLRATDAEVEHRPQPTLEDIPRLVRQAADAGAPVRLTVDGDPPAAPASVRLAAYRIVQESLNNARRHSPGADVEVRIHYAADEIQLTVDNGPTREEPMAGTTGGSGLTGIRERVATVGGECTAGPRPDGGFRVHVVLPAGAEVPG